ncbi:nuclear transport factor 2 family protein [Piscinibacter sp. XHJ-5]|uniref:nuclear transport factor 2 family protein n=1 Tax=Piscinibacter sp. XHJ-5 TaxID=3037797 RepID=UPI0024535C8B|nr:nuclear transport factor 2 family protein [Piscinibacter sp. XHJ-5]
MSHTRRAILVGAGPAFVSAAAPTAALSAPQTRPATSADPEVDALAARAEQAHAALMVGDIGRYRALIRLSDDFVLMAPFGGPSSQSARLSEERWASIGRFFRNGRDSTLELVQAYRAADMVVLAVIERTHVEVGGLKGQDWALRVTLVFRKEKDDWRLVHRHADPLVESITVEQAAALARPRPVS